MALARLKKIHNLDRRCSYCKRPTILNDRTPEFWTELDATTDHVIPQALGGDNSRANVVLACRTCNQVKDDMLPAQWFTFMNVHPRWWEHFKWGQRYPRLNRMVEHNTKTAVKYEVDVGRI